MTPSTPKNKTYSGTFGPLERVKDFLPPPEQLVLKQKPEKIKITLSLNKTSVDFFKQEAKKMGGSYQRMLRNLIHEYANKYQG